MKRLDSKFKSIYIRLFPSASRHQALAGSAPRLSTRGTSVPPQQTTNCYFVVDTKRCVCLNKSCVRSFAGCADLNLAGLWVSCRKFSDAVMLILSGQSVISRVYTSGFGNGSLGTSAEVVLKKYQVPGTVPSGKPPKSEPYRTVPCRTMQWKGAIWTPQ